LNPLRSLPLGYCANVHPGPGLARLLDGVMATAPAVAASLRADGVLGEKEPFPIGLWLSDEASRELAEPGEAEALRDRLRRRGIVVGGLNGFPFGDFHGRVVKHAVYEPHWADPRRLDFTVRLAEVLARLVPEGTASSGVTTVPIGWRATFENDAITDAAKTSLVRAIDALREVRDRTGVLVHLDVEPEPGCLLERAHETAELLAAVHEQAASEDARELLRVCHDVCHAAVLFEEQDASLAAYRERGVRIGRVQISSAIAFDGTANDFRLLRPFDEPRWLHQTAVLEGNGRVQFFEDLPKAIDEAPEGFWRIHFHVPVFAASLGRVETTREEIAECLAALRPDDGCDFLEVETYAWSALPPSLRPTSLEDGIAEELRYVRGLI
jgi:sugar phosphate isomerase/epimerase